MKLSVFKYTWLAVSCPKKRNVKKQKMSVIRLA